MHSLRTYRVGPSETNEDRKEEEEEEEEEKRGGHDFEGRFLLGQTPSPSPCRSMKGRRRRRRRIAEKLMQSFISTTFHLFLNFCLDSIYSRERERD